MEPIAASTPTIQLLQPPEQMSNEQLRDLKTLRDELQEKPDRVINNSEQNLLDRGKRYDEDIARLKEEGLIPTSYEPDL